MMQSSIDDQDPDFAGLMETQVDSDDEEGYVEAPDVSTDVLLCVINCC